MTDKATILIVDDAPSNIQILAAILKKTFHIKVATNGSDCLKIATTEPKPDLILLDVEMPDMNGYEVCERLMGDEKKPIPIIFVTGRNNDGDEEKGLNLGAVDYITKPISPAIVLARVKTHIELKQQRDAFEVMAMHDQLTGIYNRHYLIEAAQHKIARATRHKQPLSLLMLDIDHFKAVNDTYGHSKGDEVLQEVSQVLKTQNRTEDVVARFGGEEFIILLDQCDSDSAEQKSQYLRKTIEELNPSGIKITISIGIAQLNQTGDSFDDLLKRADLAVYQAKDQGRNCVVVG
ncbi:MAG: diguanylate cyclase [Oleispira sp.]|nr:diguanylate cyclase [Oleispira sp.]MBL4880369.1 diguanylate cyclase [Oleispira sp.]